MHVGCFRAYGKVVVGSLQVVTKRYALWPLLKMGAAVRVIGQLV
jgi:hypothetical protein